MWKNEVAAESRRWWLLLTSAPGTLLKGFDIFLSVIYRKLQQRSLQQITEPGISIVIQISSGTF